MNNNIQKPTELVVMDTKTDIINVLNNSGLPLTVMTMILKEISAAVDEQLSTQLPQIRESYESAQKLAMENIGVEEEK